MKRHQYLKKLRRSQLSSNRIKHEGLRGVLKEKLSKVDTTIIITVLTAISYGITYLFLADTAEYYKFPSTSIELNIETITPILIFVFLILVLIYAVWELFILNIFFPFLTAILISLTSILPSKFVNRIKSSISKEWFKTKRTFYCSMIVLVPLLVVDGISKISLDVAADQKEYMVVHQKEGYMLYCLFLKMY